MLDLLRPDWINAMSTTALAVVAVLGMLGGLLAWHAGRRRQRRPPDIDLRHEPDATTPHEAGLEAVAVICRNRASLPITLLRVEAGSPAGADIVDWRHLPTGDGLPPLMLPNAATPRPPEPPLCIRPGDTATLVAALAPITPSTAEISLCVTVRFERGMPRTRVYQPRVTIARR